MTARDDKPSIHDAITGFYEPNAVDTELGITTGTFATTINVVNGSGECGQGNDTPQAATRQGYYQNFLSFFGLPEEDGVSCAGQLTYFPYGGAADVPLFWRQDWSGEIACKPANYITGFNIQAVDDYKRCVCHFFGEGAESCPTIVEEEVEPEGDEVEPEGDEVEPEGDEVEPEGDEVEDEVTDEVEPEGDEEEPVEDEVSVEDLLADLLASLDDIRNNPVDDSTSGARTFSQVERELDLVESTLATLIEIIIAQN